MRFYSLLYFFYYMNIHVSQNRWLLGKIHKNFNIIHRTDKLLILIFPAIHRNLIFLMTTLTLKPTKMQPSLWTFFSQIFVLCLQISESGHHSLCPDGRRNFFFLFLNTHSIFSKETHLFFHSRPYFRFRWRSLSFELIVSLCWNSNFQFHFQNGGSVFLFCVRFGN